MDINIVMLTNTYKIYALYQPKKLEFAVVDNDGVIVDFGENIIELMDKYLFEPDDDEDEIETLKELVTSHFEGDPNVKETKKWWIHWNAA